jgi:hypothetical protein
VALIVAERIHQEDALGGGQDSRRSRNETSHDGESTEPGIHSLSYELSTLSSITRRSKHGARKTDIAQLSAPHPQLSAKEHQEVRIRACEALRYFVDRGRGPFLTFKRQEGFSLTLQPH